MPQTLIVVLGPTGVGKTGLSLRLAEHLHSPIINADSRQIFQEISIGTAAPTKQQQQQVRHYLVGTRHLKDYYSASMFEQDVLHLLATELQSVPTPLMTGGSMMYIDAVCDGIDDIPTIDAATRETMKKRLAEEGLPRLVDELSRLDPEHYQIVDKNNPRRVVHALEVCHMTGLPYSHFRTNTRKSRPFRVLKIGLNRPREELYERINERVRTMMDEGLEQEARSVYPLRGLNSLNTVGYRELFNYFDGKTDREEAIRQIQSNTRQYMRKQLTWFKKDERIAWFHPDNIEEIINYIDKSI